MVDLVEAIITAPTGNKLTCTRGYSPHLLQPQGVCKVRIDVCECKQCYGNKMDDEYPYNPFPPVS